MNRPAAKALKKRQEIPIHLCPKLIDEVLDVSNAHDLPAKELLHLATLLGLSQIKSMSAGELLRIAGALRLAQFLQSKNSQPKRRRA